MATCPNPELQDEVPDTQLSDAKRRLLERRLGGKSIGLQADSAAIQPRPEGSKVPLSAEQRRVWLHASQQLDAPIYNEPFTVYRYGSFSLEILEASLNEILQRHEAWRTSFSADGDVITHSSLRVSLPFVDLTELPETERDAAALRIATEDARIPIPLDAPPLFRAHVVRVKEDEHRLYLTFHHIIFDGVSIARIFMPELSTIYAAFERGMPSPLPPLELQYGDYAIWRERNVDSPKVKEHLEYWVDQLSGELPILKLPEDRRRPAITSHRGSMECFDLPAELVTDLRQLSSTQGVTLYMTLLAAFETLLFRYSGQNDIIVGSATDARRRPELEGVVGYFLDTYAIRTKPTAELSFIDLLIQTRDAVLGGLAAADVPFDRVVRAVNPKRDASQHPIFQAFFTIRPPAPQLPQGWDFTQTDVTVGASKFYLYLELGERPDRMQARFFYIANIWDSSTIKRMAAHWLMLLRSICDNPETALGDLAILTPEERRDIFEAGGWNDTAWLTPQAPLNMLFEEQVRRTPRALAAVCKQERWTYEDLDTRAEELASWLKAAGVKRGSIVAIMLDRSLDLLASLIAVHKVGAAYLPIDIHMPTERIALFLTKAQPAAIVTQVSLRKQIPSDQTIVIVDEDRDRHTDRRNLRDATHAEAANDLEDLAYVIFTSGTTGEPKGVEISQRSLVNLLLSMQTSPGFSSTDVLLAVTPVSFDIAALELFLPIICGGTIVIASREEAHDPHLLANAMRDSSCTVMQATPTTWRALLLSGWNDAHVSASHESGKMLRVLCGGEPLPRDLAAGLLTTGVELWNMYGPTETTIWSLIHRIDPVIEEEAGPMAVGRPIANTQAYILDARQRLQPTGVPGELFLGGLGLARGYRGDPEKTASRFPSISSVMNARLYATGDRAIQHADGTITVLGRTDNQVKIRGHRIELEEVEAAILRHPNVAHAAARVWPESTGDMRLSSYIVAKNDPPPNTAEMRRFLSEILPDSMIPSDVIAMPAIPLTPHGKIDRTKLPAPTAENGPSKPIRLSGPQEIRLAQIWGELLDRKHIGPTESFFDLGGHSVLVAVLQQKILVEFGQRIPITKLFHSSTVRQQATLLEPAANGQATLPPGVIALQPRGSRRGIFWVHYLNGDLAQEMGEDQPFFSLALTAEDIATLGKSPSVENIAACQVVKMLAAQPEGPYIIGGLCASGNVGFEIASQLQRAGHEVSLLIILDAKNASHPEPIEPVALKLKQIRYSWKRTQRVGYAQSIIDLRKRLLKRLALITKKQYAKTELGIAQEIIEAAARTYRPQKYEGNVLLLLASDRPPGVDFLDGWQAVASNKLQVHYVPGHHSDLIHLPCVRGVADTIKSELNSLS